VLRWYNPTETEILICDLYHTFGIKTPEELDIDLVAMIWGIDVHHYPGRPFTQWNDEGAVIMLTKGASEEENRAAFFHELCHPVKHEGYQEELPTLFKELQEIQANHFQLISAMPITLLPDPEPLWNEYAQTLSEAFHVPINLAERRINQLVNRMSQEYLYYRKYIAQWRVYA